MSAMYFGRSPRRLYGVYEPPAQIASFDRAVLLCHSAPQEYMQAHWPFRKLARQLCDFGYHVLRFDYFGTGDSAGGSSEGSISQWRNDIQTAANELSDLAAVEQISIVGFRLGATLALQTSLNLEKLVLWEPVIKGGRYIERLRTMHNENFAHCLYPPKLPTHGHLLELMGHPFPPELEDDIRAIDLVPPFSCSAENIAIIPSQDIGECRKLAAVLQDGSKSVSLICEDEGGSVSPFLTSSRVPLNIAEYFAGEPK